MDRALLGSCEAAWIDRGEQNRVIKKSASVQLGMSSELGTCFRFVAQNGESLAKEKLDYRRMHVCNFQSSQYRWIRICSDGEDAKSSVR